MADPFNLVVISEGAIAMKSQLNQSLNQESKSIKEEEDLKTLLSEIQAEKGGVSITSFVTAYWINKLRKIKNLKKVTQHGKVMRKDDLFADNSMGVFFNKKDKVKDIVKKMMPPHHALSFTVRHEYMNQVLEQAYKDGFLQVVSMGSGLSETRPAENLHPQIKFFEIDFEKVLNYKAHVFAKNDIKQHATYLGLDYTKEDFMTRLIKEGLDPSKPTLFIWEGNVSYLEKYDVEKVLKTIFTSFSAEVRVTFDYLTQAFIDNIKKYQTSTTKVLDKFAMFRAPIKTGFDNLKTDLVDVLNKLKADPAIQDIHIRDEVTCDKCTIALGAGDKPIPDQKNYSFVVLSSGSSTPVPVLTGPT
jgi:methyltransferase (TIGR00027 family)